MYLQFRKKLILYNILYLWKIILDFSSVTLFGRDQLANIWQANFFNPKESCFIIVWDFVCKQRELALVITPICVYGFWLFRDIQ